MGAEDASGRSKRSIGVGRWAARRTARYTVSRALPGQLSVPMAGAFRLSFTRYPAALALVALVYSRTRVLIAQSALVGVVVEDSSRAPLVGVEIVLEGSGRKVLTTPSGRYLLDNLEEGGHSILFRHVGSRAVRLRVQLRPRDTVRYDAAMVREGPQELEPLEVTAGSPKPTGIGREGFEERRRLGFGKFIDSTELRRSENRRVPDMLRAVPGVRIVRFRECERNSPNRCGPVEERAATGRGDTSLYRRSGRDEYCWMSVIWDGHPLYWSSSGTSPPDLGRLMRVAEIHAIEIYRSAGEAPTEYSGASGQCGVILLWSRRG